MTKEDIEDQLDGYKQTTKNQNIIVLRDFFRWLYDLEDGEPLPPCIKNIKPRAIEIDDVKYAERVVTPNEYASLLEHCNKPMHRALIEALWVSGGRKDEIQPLRVGDVSYDGNVTRILIRNSKTQSREIIHPGRAENLLKWTETLCPFVGQKDKPLFVSKLGGDYRQIHDRFAWDLLDDLCRRIPMRHIKPHDIRHTCATNYLKNGVPDTHVKTLMGWKKNSSMLRVYDHNGIKDYEAWEATGNPQRTAQNQRRDAETHRGEHPNDYRVS
jgi:integrase